MSHKHKPDLTAFALISIGEIAAKDRSQLDPSEFFGFEQVIKDLQEDPKAAVQKIVAQAFGIEWDKVASLRQTVISRFSEQCSVERGLAHLNVSERKAEAAKKILDNYNANGGVSRKVVEEAESVLAEFGKRMEANEKPELEAVS